MAEPSLSTSRLCGDPSPLYPDPDRPDRCIRDLCMRPAGHRGSHRWWGYADSWKRRTA